MSRISSPLHKGMGYSPYWTSILAMGGANNMAVKTDKKPAGRKRLARKLREHLTNLDQVEVLLKAEPENEELKQLKSDLHQLIWLISDNLSSLKKKTTPNDVMVDAADYVQKFKGTCSSPCGPLVVPIIVKDPLNLSQISVKLVEMKDIASIPGLPDFFYDTGPMPCVPKGQGVKRKRGETKTEAVNGEDKPDATATVVTAEGQCEGQTVQDDVDDGDGSGSPKRIKKEEEGDDTVTETVPATNDDPCPDDVNGDQIDQSSPKRTDVEKMNGESNNIPSTSTIPKSNSDNGAHEESTQNDADPGGLEAEEMAGEGESNDIPARTCPKDDSEGQNSQEDAPDPDIKKIVEDGKMEGEINETAATATPEGKDKEQGSQNDSGFKEAEVEEMNGDENSRIPTPPNGGDNGEHEESIQNDTEPGFLRTELPEELNEANVTNDVPTITSSKDGIGSEGQNSQEDAPAPTSDIKKEAEDDQIEGKNITTTTAVTPDPGSANEVQETPENGPSYLKTTEDEVMPNEDNDIPTIRPCTSSDAKNDEQCSQNPSDIKPEDGVKVEEMVTEDIATSSNNNDKCTTNDDQVDDGTGDPGEDKLKISEAVTVISNAKNPLNIPKNSWMLKDMDAKQRKNFLRKKRRAIAKKAAEEAEANQLNLSTTEDVEAPDPEPTPVNNSELGSSPKKPKGKKLNDSKPVMPLTVTAKRNKRKRNAKRNARIREFLRDNTIVMMGGKIIIQSTPTESSSSSPPLCQNCQKGLV